MYVLLELYKNELCSACGPLFSEPLVNVWNSLPDSTDFSTLPRFRRSILRVSFSKFLKCFSVIIMVYYVLCVFIFVCHC